MSNKCKYSSFHYFFSHKSEGNCSFLKLLLFQAVSRVFLFRTGIIRTGLLTLDWQQHFTGLWWWLPLRLSKHQSLIPKQSFSGRDDQNTLQMVPMGSNLFTVKGYLPRDKRPVYWPYAFLWKKLKVRRCFKVSFLFGFEVADNGDILPQKAYFDDDRYELSIQYWQWQRYCSSLFDVQNRLQEMRKLSGTYCSGFTWSFMIRFLVRFWVVLRLI